ncbi:hypothetical protein EHM76_04355 [bacterium]|nr:MAG: hypothetical protein EHM76_04355 [bacterium]
MQIGDFEVIMNDKTERAVIRRGNEEQMMALEGLNYRALKSIIAQLGEEHLEEGIRQLFEALEKAFPRPPAYH